MQANDSYDDFTVSDVVAVVILYNPNESVIKNIASYINQVSKIYVVDNSEKSSSIVEEYCLENEKVAYVLNGQNLGIAACLNIVSERAIKEGYTYLLTMDQDSIAPDNLVECLLMSAKKLENVGIVSPLHSNKFETHKQMLDRKIDSPDIVMTSGNLLSLEAFKKAGKFSEDYFIDYVDVEYCLKLKSKGFKVYRDNSVILKHNEANLSEINIFGWKIYPTNNEPIRIYYKTRNLLYLNRDYNKSFSSIIRRENNIYLKNILKIICFEKKKISKINMLLIGVIDFLRKKRARKS